VAGFGFLLRKNPDRLGGRAQDAKRRNQMHVEHGLKLLVGHFLDR
jgi:hypothetical protein